MKTKIYDIAMVQTGVFAKKSPTPNAVYLQQSDFDEEGNEVEFEFLDVVEVDEKEYVVLLPVEEADKGEVVIFRIEGSEEDESYVSLDNEEEAEKVFQAFKEKTKDEFDFAD